MTVTSKQKTSKIDHSGIEALEEMIGSQLPEKIKRVKFKNKKLRGPWKNDFKNSCAKCSTTFHLQRHHITYEPELTVFLCYECHRRITGLNARGSSIAHGNIKTRTTYTNRIRVILWRWFLNSRWPVTSGGNPIKRLSRTFVKEILQKANFKIEVQSLGELSSNAGERLNKSHLNTELLSFPTTGDLDKRSCRARKG